MEFRDNDDAFLWLENINSPDALSKVRAWNDATAAPILNCTSFRETERRMRSRLEATDRVAYPVLVHDQIFNFWTDEHHQHGIWRRTELEDYVNNTPNWCMLLDLDALAREEAKNWVWAGAVFPHEPTGRAMIALSDGGTDAVAWREFDLNRRMFVPEGFRTPMGKSEIVWLDPDTLLLSCDIGPAAITASGYPARVVRWQRGTRLTDAVEIACVDTDAMLIQPVVYNGGTSPRPAIWSMVDYYRSTLDHLDNSGRSHRSPLPLTAEALVAHNNMVVALLHDAMVLDGRSVPEGTLVAYSIDELLAGRPSLEVVMSSPALGAICNVLSTAAGLLIHTIEEVQSRLSVYIRDESGCWKGRSIKVPAFSSLLLGPGQHDRRDYFYKTCSFLAPAELHYVSPDGTDRVIACQPSELNMDSIRVSQDFVTSRDGTRIPYFILRPNHASQPLPALIQAYGGFRAPMLPLPLGPLEQSWLEAGRILVVPNLRGGGEFGPSWHRQAMRENRQRIFDDLHSIAQALRAAPDISSVAIEGSCNGGLLAGVAFTQRPDLYDAVLMGSPITDMLRYHLLLAGASWIAEYGDPENPIDRAYLRSYSPYHNIRSDRSYPPVFLFAALNDDRVHPAHARKMAALLEDKGHSFGFYECQEGGHYCASGHRQQAFLSAVLFHWLEHALGLDIQVSPT